jgi:hypothetical protein
MTTIAWDGRIVAADSLGVAGGGRSFLPSKKIVEEGGVIFAACGRMGPMLDAWAKWWKDGADPTNVPPQGGSTEDCGNFIVFADGRCFIFSHMVPYACEEAAPFAIGSGADYAVGAMKAGADACRAVEIAIECDVNSGGPVEVIFTAKAA